MLQVKLMQGSRIEYSSVKRVSGEELPTMKAVSMS